MNQNNHSLWKTLALEALPEEDATLEQMIQFSRSADPTTYFHEYWGSDYQTKVKALWENCIQLFKSGKIATATSEELLMCLSYDIALGPYLGVPEPHKLLFLKWLVSGIKHNLLIA